MKKYLFIKLLTITMLFPVIFAGCKKDNDTPVTGVALNKEFLTLSLGDTETLIATIQPKNATNQTLIWESSIPAVASVIGNGMVTTLSPGKTIILVRTADGNKMATCEVTVKKVQTKEDLLTQEKGWGLTAATCDPPFELEEDNQITNLFDGFFWDCELDDILFFLKNKSQVLNYGKYLCDDELYPSGTELFLGNWDWIDDSHLLFYVPVFFNAPPLTATILTLDDKTLKLKFSFDADDGINDRGSKDSKTIREYTFTFTYTKADNR